MHPRRKSQTWLGPLARSTTWSWYPALENRATPMKGKRFWFKSIAIVQQSHFCIRASQWTYCDFIIFSFMYFFYMVRYFLSNQLLAGSRAPQIIILSNVNMLLICFVPGICLHGQSWRCSESGWLNRTLNQATETHSFSRQGAVKTMNKKRNVACKVLVQLNMVSFYYRNPRVNYLQIL